MLKRLIFLFIFVYRTTASCDPTNKCGINEIFTSCASCSPQLCETIGLSYSCPANCKPGCRCKNDYVRNSKNVCVSANTCPKCPVNEVYHTCASSCPPEGCDSSNIQVKCRAPPQPGDPDCKSGCKCKSGYYRNKQNVCVPKEQCEPKIKCGPHEVVTSCYSTCPPQLCEIRNGSFYSCPAMLTSDCKPGCRCAKNYVRNSRNICVSIDTCPKCPANETYHTCAPTCPPEGCDSSEKQFKCRAPPQPGDLDCKPGCRCNPGHYRNKKNVCVPKDRCEPKNPCKGLNEVLSDCPPKCPPQTCAGLAHVYFCPKQPVPGSPDCVPACICKENYLRDDNNICIPKEKCQVKCERPYEVWVPCPMTCPPQTCNSIGKTYHCPLNVVNPKDCKGACMCEKGYYRNAIGECISKEQCLRCPGEHEYYSCGGACDNICQLMPYQNISSCPIINVKCNEKCYCEDGYARNSYGICVPISKCEPPCTPNEEYRKCLPTCPKDTCEDSTRRQASCPRLHILIPRCKSGCACKPGLFRNKDNKCVPYKQCPLPSSCCPKGEVLNMCPSEDDPCEGEHCPTSECSKQTCNTPKKCGRPQCTCAFGRLRDRKTGKCILAQDCPPFECTGENEEYQKCPPICPGETCDDCLSNEKCPKYRIVVPCKPQCRCKKGYYRNEDNVCIPGCECYKSDDDGGSSNPSTSTEEDLEAFSKGNQNMSARFYQVVAAEKPGESVIMSSYLVMFPLGLLALYSENEAESQLLGLLNLNSKDQVRSTLRAELDIIKEQTHIELKLAFEIFTNDQYTVSDPFIEDATYLDSGAQSIDFSDSNQAAKTINTWAEDHTNNKIKDLVSPDDLDTGTATVLTSAIYFKGDWEKPFNPNHTADKDFYVDNDTVIKVPTMYQTGLFEYTESEEIDAKCIRLYYKGFNASLDICLPNKIDGLSDMQKKLEDPDVLKNLQSSLQNAQVEVSLPKFKIETTTDLSNVLKEIGLTKIFQPDDSDLVGIFKDNKPPYYVSSAVQKAFIEVNELGSEAAAANGISTRPPRPGPPTMVYQFKADHPYYFKIYVNGDPLFIGSYSR